MVLAPVSLTVRAADPTMLFWDNISGYTLNAPPTATLYENKNFDVVHSQNNGNLSVASTIGGWSKTTPDQLVYINSGIYSTYNTVAVNRNSTVRYGQIVVRLGKDVTLEERFQHVMPLIPMIKAISIKDCHIYFKDMEILASYWLNSSCTTKRRTI